MKFTNIIQWVREKAKWLVLGLVAIGVVVGEIETGIGTQLVREAKEAWDMPESDTSPVAIVAALMSSVSLRCSHVAGQTGSGSGNLIHKFGHTYVLTAAHVVQCEVMSRSNALDKVYMTVYQGTNEWRAYVINYDSDHDLALLRLESTNLVGRSVRFLSPSIIPLIGTKVLHVGNLQGAFPRSYSEGVIAMVNAPAPADPFHYYDQTTVTAYPGSSGGGIFTADGRYAGMILQWAGPGVNFVCPVRRMVEWADRNDLLWLFY